MIKSVTPIKRLQGLLVGIPSDGYFFSRNSVVERVQDKPTSFFVSLDCQSSKKYEQVQDTQ